MKFFNINFNIKNLLNNNFDKEASDLPGIINSDENKELIKSFYLDTIDKVKNGTLDLALPSGVNAGQLSGDLVNITAAWQVLKTFAPELTVINTFNLDSCHNSFSNYFNFLH